MIKNYMNLKIAVVACCFLFLVSLHAHKHDEPENYVPSYLMTDNNDAGLPIVFETTEFGSISIAERVPASFQTLQMISAMAIAVGSIEFLISNNAGLLCLFVPPFLIYVLKNIWGDASQ